MWSASHGETPQYIGNSRRRRDLSLLERGSVKRPIFTCVPSPLLVDELAFAAALAQEGGRIGNSAREQLRKHSRRIGCRLQVSPT